MTGPGGERLHIVRRIFKNEASEACVAVEETGARTTLLRLFTPAAQRAYLLELGDAFPTFMRGGALCALLPYFDGITPEQFYRERAPDFRTLRDLCAGLAQELDREGGPPALLYRRAGPESLTICGDRLCLQYFLDYSGPPAPDERAACTRTARLLLSFCSGGARLSGRRLSSLPPECRLVIRRAQAGGYGAWGEIARDFAALPAALPAIITPDARLRAEAARLVRRLSGPAARYGPPLVLAGLAALAALCCAGAFLSRKPAEAPPAGVVSVGNQSWGAPASDSGKEDAP